MAAKKKSTKSSKKNTKAAQSSRIRKTKSKKTSNQKKRPLWVKLLRACIVIGLWCGIIGILTIAWFATELPGITSDVKFERKRAITFLANDGSVIAQIGELKGESINSEDLPIHVIHALLSTEDRRFYNHFGLDPLGIARAMVTNVRAGRFAQGGSTITQQLAKNLFLTQDRTLKRKIQEAILAIWLERQLTKDEILTAYFNRVYFGSGTYGIEAASQKYFQKSARDLSVYEGALLVGLLKAPSRYSPINSPERAKKRTDVVLASMKDAGYHYREVSGGEFKFVENTVSDGRQHRYFIDWLMDEVNRNVGAIEDDLIIQTTLSVELQDRAEKALLDKLNVLSDVNVSQGAIIVLENDGAVRAMVGGKDYGQSQFNRATQALRPPGSAFKPFVYLTALNRGWSPNDRILDAPITEGSYRPKNFADLYYGEVTLREALAKSMNTAVVRLAQNIGTIGYVIGTARKLGITADLERDMSLALGSSGISLLEMTSAYTVFPNDGIRPNTYAILSIQDEDANTYYNFNPDERRLQRVFRRNIINDMDSMLENVVSNGTAQAASPGYRAAGKTGTSQDFRDAWFIGYTAKYTAGIWLGNDDNSPTDRMTGGKAPAEIWAAIMRGKANESAQPVIEYNANPVQRAAPRNRPQENEEGGFSGFISKILSAGQKAQENNPEPRYND